MVTTRQEFQTEWKIPNVRLEASHLVDIIEKCSIDGEKITAKNGLHDFDGINDMRENCELLAGEPRVTIGCTEIYFESGFLRGVYHRHYIDGATFERSETIARKLKTLLKPHRTYVRTLWFRYVAASALAAAAGIISASLSEDPWNPLVFAFLTLQISIILFNKLLRSDIVYYSPSATFWQRNRDTILVGVIMFFIGAIGSRALESIGL